jgi:hypothetical protein
MLTLPRRSPGQLLEGAMRRELAIPLAALVAACSPPGSSDGSSQSSAQRSTAPRQIAETTQDGLAAFHLAQSGEGRVAFGSSAVEGGVQVFSDVVFRGDDGSELRAETLRIAGARETADGSLFDRLEIVDLVGSDGVDEFTVDRILIEDPNPLFATVIAQALSDEGVDEDADWGAFTDYAFRTLAVEGFGADSDDGAFALEALRFSDLSGGVLGGFAFEGLTGSGDADGSQVSFELGSWTMNGLDLSGADAFSARDVEDPEDLQAALFESGFNDPFRKHYDDYALEDVRIDVDGVMVSLASFEGTAQQTRVGVETEDTLDGLVVEFDGKRNLGAQALQMLSFLDYDRIEINGHLEQTANQVEDRIVSDEYSITASDAFALELDYDFGGVRAYMENVAEQGFDITADMSPEAMTELLGPLLVHGFELRLVDDSIVERALAAAATMQGQTPDQVREQAIAIMTVGTMMVPPGPVQALAMEAIGATGDFLTEPGTLRITLSPDEPVALSDLLAAFESEDYDSAVGLLNIEVAAE